jgi:hypothetical protein
MWTGRTDSNKRIIFSDKLVLIGLSIAEAQDVANAPANIDSISHVLHQVQSKRSSNIQLASITNGAYVIVKVIRATGHTLRGIPISLSSIQEADAIGLNKLKYQR